MNKLTLSLLLSGLLLSVSAQIRNELKVPDIDGYKTLKCDFHTHTVFSDGLVWPTVRVDEAYREGLDAISITEHIEYRPHKKDIVASHNRSYEIAENTAKAKDIILIKGSEITRPMAPGHFNAIYLNDCDKLDKEEYQDAFKAAKDQHAFIFWNHPGWDAQQPEETKWWPEHTELYNNGCMNGIEVANGGSYFPEALAWCLEKGLTMIGTSDVHQPIQSSVDFAKGNHRTMTFVFAEERTAESIREALDKGRTAVYFNDMVIGKENLLKEFFKQAIEIQNIKKTKNGFSVTLKNNSDLIFFLKKNEHDPTLTYFRNYTIQPNCKHSFSIKTDKADEKAVVRFEVTNLLIAPEKGLEYELALN